MKQPKNVSQLYIGLWLKLDKGCHYDGVIFSFGKLLKVL